MTTKELLEGSLKDIQERIVTVSKLHNEAVSQIEELGGLLEAPIGARLDFLYSSQTVIILGLAEEFVSRAIRRLENQ